MSPTEKAEKAAGTARSVNARAEAAKARCEENARIIGRIADSLDVAQTDLRSIGGNIGEGMRDLRRDVEKLLTSARRDLRKMGSATRRDLEKLQRDLAATAKAGPGTARGTTATAGRRPGAAAAKRSSARSGAATRRRAPSARTASSA